MFQDNFGSAQQIEPPHPADCLGRQREHLFERWIHAQAEAPFRPGLPGLLQKSISQEQHVVIFAGVHTQRPAIQIDATEFVALSFRLLSQVEKRIGPDRRNIDIGDEQENQAGQDSRCAHADGETMCRRQALVPHPGPGIDRPRGEQPAHQKPGEHHKVIGNVSRLTT